jgi:hypothetical protein
MTDAPSSGVEFWLPEPEDGDYAEYESEEPPHGAVVLRRRDGAEFARMSADAWRWCRDQAIRLALDRPTPPNSLTRIFAGAVQTEEIRQQVERAARARGLTVSVFRRDSLRQATVIFYRMEAHYWSVVGVADVAPPGQTERALYAACEAALDRWIAEHPK